MRGACMIPHTFHFPVSLLSFVIHRALVLGFKNIIRYLGRLPPYSSLMLETTLTPDHSNVDPRGKPNVIARASGERHAHA